MNGTEPSIEIFKPFQEAIDLTKKVLFQPFDLSKWCVIGFAAFLSHLSGAGGNFNFRLGNWGGSSHHAASEQLPSWVLPVVLAVVVPLALICVVAFLWLGSRGRFIFADCIVRNRAAIAAPWKEYRKEANSFFLFTLLVAAIFAGFIILAAVPAVIMVHDSAGSFPKGLIIELIIFVPLFLVLVIVWALISVFMVPVMYRQRCKAMQGLREVVSLIKRYPGEFVLFFLFSIALGIATVIVLVVMICATCCLVLIPYVGTVILLPVYVVSSGFLLLFLRQFGPAYDVWAGLPPGSPTEPPPPEPVAAAA